MWCRSSRVLDMSCRRSRALDMSCRSSRVLDIPGNIPVLGQPWGKLVTLGPWIAQIAPILLLGWMTKLGNIVFSNVAPTLPNQHCKNMMFCKHVKKLWNGSKITVRYYLPNLGSEIQWNCWCWVPEIGAMSGQGWTSNINLVILSLPSQPWTPREYPSCAHMILNYP